MRYYYIKDEYINFLKKYDDKIADNKNESRPYIGVVFEIEGHKYYAPLSSPKPKHNKMKNYVDFRKIENGKLGVINLSHMIPVVDSVIIPIKFCEITDLSYRRLLQKQYSAINKDNKNIEMNAKKLRAIVFSSDDKLTNQEKNVKSRCSNMPLLEKKSKEYEKTEKKEQNKKNIIRHNPNIKKAKVRVSIKDKLPEMKEKSDKLFGKSQSKQQEQKASLHKNKSHHEEL